MVFQRYSCHANHLLLIDLFVYCGDGSVNALTRFSLFTGGYGLKHYANIVA